MSNTISVVCPNCSHQFPVDIDKAIAGNVEATLKAQMERDFKERALSYKKKLEEENERRLALYKKDIEDKEKRIQNLAKTEIELQELQNRLANIKEEAELEARKKLAEREAQIKADAERLAEEKAKLIFAERESQLKVELQKLELEKIKAAQEAAERVRYEEQLKQKELQEKLDKQVKLAEEMKRKAEQGSMQAQGEILELELERMLRDMYPFDEITEVKKGQKGADILQIVRTNHGVECGKIYYEVKRTKAFEEKWIKKLKEDNLQTKADILVIATEAMPEGENRYCIMDGVWICSFTEVKGLSLALRYGLIQMNDLKIVQSGKETKMEQLYSYLTGNEFKSQFEAIINGFRELQIGYEDEKMKMQKIWKQREKQLERIIGSAVGFYGSLKGIAGSSVPDIKLLEGDTGADELTP